ncbi:hypothetical protein GQ53DRAFT_402527 [Thozetella sp. PMI_491]|nr:hypothetical protein GQ53DRAFT_402527 [Thozetella sp. PMI_491]
MRGNVWPQFFSFVAVPVHTKMLSAVDQVADHLSPCEPPGLLHLLNGKSTCLSTPILSCDSGKVRFAEIRIPAPIASCHTTHRLGRLRDVKINSQEPPRNPCGAYMETVVTKLAGIASRMEKGWVYSDLPLDDNPERLTPKWPPQDIGPGPTICSLLALASRPRRRSGSTIARRTEWGVLLSDESLPKGYEGIWGLLAPRLP